jgi:GNAT superfamily N-acetyltransferase
MNFTTEKVTDQLVEDLLPLLRMHYEEIAHHKDIKLEPDFEKYKAMSDLGAIRVYTARDEQNNAAGYAVFFVNTNIHYSLSKQAVQDIIYIDPKRRGFGLKFIDWCDRQLRDEGVQMVYHHVKAKHNFGPLLERIGYELIDHIYGRRLDIPKGD